MIAVLASILSTIIDLGEAHPDIAKALLMEARDLISGHTAETLANVEAVRAMAAGLARARADAVQAAVRRQAK